MRNSELVNELVSRLEDHSENVMGAYIDKRRAVTTMTIDDADLSAAVQTVLKAIGLEPFMKVKKCEETAQYPEMDYLELDINGMDTIHVAKKEPVKVGQENAPKRLLYYALLQLPERHDQCFRPLTRPLNLNNIADPSVELGSYKIVYGGPMSVSKELSDIEICEMLFDKFNRDDRPNSKTSRSMSVSDIICMDDDKYYFCDSSGFVPLTKSGKAML